MLFAFTFTFLVIKSLLRQRVQIFAVKVVPSISVFTFFRLGFHVRLVRFLAWLTLFPVDVRFPQISQVLDIISFLKPRRGENSIVFIFVPDFTKSVKRGIIRYGQYVRLHFLAG